MAARIGAALAGRADDSLRITPITAAPDPDGAGRSSLGVGGEDLPAGGEGDFADAQKDKGAFGDPGAQFGAAERGADGERGRQMRGEGGKERAVRCAQILSLAREEQPGIAA